MSKEKSKQVISNLKILVEKSGHTAYAVAIAANLLPQNVSRMLKGENSLSFEKAFEILDGLNQLTHKNYTLKDIDIKPEND
jgi:hypothetical protein